MSTEHPSKYVREWLGLDVYTFAEILGVASSSVYRWETSTKDSGLTGLQRTIVEALTRAMEKIPAKRRETAGRKLGDTVRRAQISRGTFGGLHALLTYLTETPS